MTTLEKAEQEIREGGMGLTGDERKAIADELDRLRAELAALKGEAERTVYAPGTDARDAIATVLGNGDMYSIGSGDWENMTAEECKSAWPTCEPYAVRLTARKVEP